MDESVVKPRPESSNLDDSTADGPSLAVKARAFQAKDFESRKADHIRFSLEARNQAAGLSGLDRVELIHEALPDVDFDKVDLSCKNLNKKRRVPFLISSMTAGHAASPDLNLRLARAAQDKGWWMAVGSQRRELDDKEAAKEWKQIRKAAGKVQWLGNLGLAQVIRAKPEAIEALVDALEAEAMIIHLNPLQECMQPEGTPQFAGGLKAITRLVKALSVPVVVKETGCGMSKSTMKRLWQAGVAAVDVSGLGGTHWGRIEGDRASESDVRKAAARTFSGWGIATVESVFEAAKLKKKTEIWASGGVRTGLDAAKLLAMGARNVGFALPILDAALRSEEDLLRFMDQVEFELKVAMFCTGVKNLTELKDRKVWRWQRILETKVEST